jgi:hypothetical protein
MHLIFSTPFLGVCSFQSEAHMKLSSEFRSIFGLFIYGKRLLLISNLEFTFDIFQFFIYCVIIMFPHTSPLFFIGILFRNFNGMKDFVQVIFQHKHYFFLKMKASFGSVRR